jgi:hypothetical protein
MTRQPQQYQWLTSRTHPRTVEDGFEPAVRRDRVLAHFGARRRFSMKNDDVVYENRDTG